MATTTTLPSTKPIDQLIHKLSDVRDEPREAGRLHGRVSHARVRRENPFQGLAMAFGVGYLIKSLFPGPLSTLAVIGGGAYAASKLAK